MLALASAPAQTTILHLKNGDRLAGTVLSEDTNRLVISTSWIKELAVPKEQIVQRETVASAGPTPKPAAATNSTALPAAAPVGSVGVPHTPTLPKHWKGDARIGADFLYGAKDQQIYYGRFKLTYERPYPSNPKHFFRNIFDYTVDYGWTETAGSTNSSSLLSANRMSGSDKTTVDIGGRNWFVYNLASVGYDQIRKIDLQYEVGPGFGYHVWTRTNLAMNLESGMDYQAEYRSDETRKKDVYFRIGEDLSLKLNNHLTLTEKVEFFPRINSTDYRARAESTLSYSLWHNLSLNLTLLDLYDTQPASGVPTNDLQIHSSLGITF